MAIEKSSKQVLIDAVTKRLELPKKSEGALIVNEVFAIVSDILAKSGKVSISGFGIFTVTKRAARQGINPRTRETIQIPERKTVSFKAGKSLKLSLGNGKKTTKVAVSTVAKKKKK